MSNAVKTVFGGGNFGNHVTSIEDTKTFLDKLRAVGITTIDTAQAYPNSEQLLGDVGARHNFTLDTKQLGGNGAGLLTEAKILERGKESLEKLQVKQVDVFYIHVPDYEQPLDETLKGINAFYETGGFKRFGLSNYAPEDVQEVYDICKKNGYVLPSVYQGNYNAIARRSESELFPILRKLGMSFYAYSPTAGGFLTKTPNQINDGVGRFDKENKRFFPYHQYTSAPYLAALEAWRNLSVEKNIPAADLAVRWMKFNSGLSAENGDALIIGARTLEQLDETAKAFEAGPLPDDLVKRIEDLWETLRDSAVPAEFVKLPRGQK